MLYTFISFWLNFHSNAVGHQETEVLKFFTVPGFLLQNNAKPSLGSQSKIFVERSDHKLHKLHYE